MPDDVNIIGLADDVAVVIRGRIEENQSKILDTAIEKL